MPEGVNWKRVVDRLMERERLEIAGGLGGTAGKVRWHTFWSLHSRYTSIGKVWRIGLMGANATEHNVRHVLASLTEALQAQGYSP